MPFYEYQCPKCNAILETVRDYPPPEIIERRCSFCEKVRAYKLVRPGGNNANL